MRSARIVGLLTVLTVTMMLMAGFAAVPAGADGNGTQKKAVIVGFKGEMDGSLIRAYGGSIDHRLSIANAIATRLPESAIAALERNPNVAYVENDIQMHAVGQVLPWGVDRIDAELAWGGSDGDNSVPTSGAMYTGSGIQVAVVDTGIDMNHPDLAANYAGGYDFVNGDSDPSDDNGHGTHVSGTIAGVDNTEGVIGVAPNADIYALKVLGKRGSGFLSDVVAGIQWAVNGPDGTEGNADDAEVVSMSLGASSGSSTLKAAVDNALAKGTLPVAAAGNDGSSSVSYPAAYSSVVAVSAIDSNDALASFSNYGSAIELAAPGVNVYSTMPTYDVDLTSSGPVWARYSKNYDYLSGTSMATPHVSGVAALAFEAGPTDANGDGNVADDVRKVLQDTAEDMGASGWDNKFGYGLVDAEAAVNGVSSGAPTVSITSPTDGATVMATVTIAASASDSDGTVSSVQFFVDGSSLGTDGNGGDGWQYDWDSTGVSDGQHVLKATATDNDGNTASDTVTVTVDNIDNAPTVSWANPGDGDTVAGTVSIRVAASDDRGITSVQWKVGSSGTYSTATLSSGYYQDTWDTTALSDGDYILYAKATDNGGNSMETSIQVTVSNTVGGMYVWDISWKETGPHLRATVTIQYDSDNNGVAEASDGAVSGATVYFTLAMSSGGMSFTGTTDSGGQVSFTWRQAPNGDYVGEVTGLTHSTYTWDSLLDNGNPSYYTK